MSSLLKLEVARQTASENYDCDGGCGEPILDETDYVRVAHVYQQPGRIRPTADLIEKFHPDCWVSI